MSFKNIDPDIILKYDRQIPRYTSYPTAPHFKEEKTDKLYLNWLKEIPDNSNISLYFHIPFCEKLCWYCGCNTQIINHYSPVERYLIYLKKEISMISGLIKDKNLKICHIHFGGGSPTIIDPVNFEDLFFHIRENFNIIENAEIAIEVDPRNIDEQKAKIYQKVGINRVSFGVQDFDLNVQKLINREQPFELVEKICNLFRKYSINNLNFDFIYGLPGQTLDIITNNIKLIQKLDPDRIAFFGYAHVPWVKKYMRFIKDEDLPSAKDRIELYNIIAKNLQKIGYQAIGLDHFAKKDSDIIKQLKERKLKRNFQGYSTDKANILIGMGISSISYLPSGYAQNTTKNIPYPKFIDEKQLPISKIIKINKEDKIRKAIIDEIMCYLDIDLNKFIKDFDLKSDYFNQELQNLQELQKEGLIIINDHNIKINPKTPQIARVVSSFFDQYFDNKSNSKHSKAI
ncbi:oxygen-independent coproporphyrinogen III oxidase [Rickettsiales bacterium]|nr:oxygen-independent coproporphyrinogen III oxidase [Rickettsiales bacterium]